MTDQASRQRRGPVFNIPLTKWQRRQKHLQEQPSNTRALIGFTADGQAVVNPVQAELRRLFKGIVSRPVAARLEGMKYRSPSTRTYAHEFAEMEPVVVHVEQTNQLCSEDDRGARRVSLAERDRRTGECLVDLRERVALRAAERALEASAEDAPKSARRGSVGKRRHGANRARSHKVHA